MDGHRQKGQEQGAAGKARLSGADPQQPNHDQRDGRDADGGEDPGTPGETIHQRWESIENEGKYIPARSGDLFDVDDRQSQGKSSEQDGCRDRWQQ